MLILKQYDSREICLDDIFLCLPGGEKFIMDALGKGAKEIQKVTRAQMAKIAAAYYKNPSENLCVIGITGTAGKTTVANLINDALNQSGFNSAYLGTICPIAAFSFSIWILLNDGQ